MTNHESSGVPLTELELKVQQHRQALNNQQAEAARVRNEAIAKRQAETDRTTQLLVEIGKVAEVAVSVNMKPRFQLFRNESVSFPRSIVKGSKEAVFLMPAWNLATATQGNSSHNHDSFTAPSQGLALSTDGVLYIYSYLDIPNSGILDTTLSYPGSFDRDYNIVGFTVGGPDKLEITNSAVEYHLIRFAAQLN